MSIPLPLTGRGTEGEGSSHVGDHHHGSEEHATDEVAGLAAKIGEPGGTPFKHATPGAPLDSAAAKAGNAVVTAAPSN